MVVGHWVQASRPLAHGQIVVPIVLGQAAAWRTAHMFDPWWLVAALLWGIFAHLFIVFGNDVADHQSDGLVQTWLSGGSGVIPSGKLSVHTVRRAMWCVIAVFVAWSLCLAVHDRRWTLAYTLVALGLLWSYSFPPFRLSYRGGGEWLQAVGMGVGLPSLGFYMQGAGFFAPYWMIVPATLGGLCSNVLTALPDLEVDQVAHKRTVPVRWGNRPAKVCGLTGVVVSAAWAAWWTPGLSSLLRWVLFTLPCMPVVLASVVKDPLHTAWLGSMALQLAFIWWGISLVWFW